MFVSYNNDKSAFVVTNPEDEVLGCGGIGPLAGTIESICELKKCTSFLS